MGGVKKTRGLVRLLREHLMPLLKVGGEQEDPDPYKGPDSPPRPESPDGDNWSPRPGNFNPLRRRDAFMHD